MSNLEETRHTELYEEHVKAGGRMVPFAGFAMPVQFEGIAKEHQRVRTAVGLFDVSHMGEVLFRGPRAEQVIQRITTNNVACKPGRAVYSPVCLPSGGIIDDMIFYRRGETEWFVCVNASNKDKDYAWFVEQTAGECEVLDLSDGYSQIAVQGPNAPTLLARILGDEITGLRPFSFVDRPFQGADCIVATTGYTGEAGGEIYVPNDVAAPLWRTLLEKGQDLGVGPIGLGARDSLRLDMKYCLYGNDIDETTTPLEAGLAWTVKFDKGDFVGRDAMLRQKEAGVPRHLVAFTIDGKGIPRHGYKLLSGDDEIGVVTSGTLSPSVSVPIGMGYVTTPFAAVGSRFEMDLKGLRRAAATVVAPPFYKREAKV